MQERRGKVVPHVAFVHGDEKGYVARVEDGAERYGVLVIKLPAAHGHTVVLAVRVGDVVLRQQHAAGWRR
jgi:hypothetical protein